MKPKPVFATALVLGAGRSLRLGQPKQLLDYRGRPLLQSVVDTARSGPFGQVIITIGGAAPEVRAAIDFGDATVVENVHFTSGCSSSIVAALDEVDARADGVMLLLGDQPEVSVQTMEHLLQRVGSAPLAVCRYANGLGHPFWFGRDLFDDLRALHGDKGVWKLIGSGARPLLEVSCEGEVPLDVDTWDDYERLLAQEATS